MICKMCATGADMRSRLKEVQDFTPKQRAKTVVVAALFHEECKGLTHCDCQHGA